MKLTKIKLYRKPLTAVFLLPAGAIPLAQSGKELICYMPTGDWIGALDGCIVSKDSSISRDVFHSLTEHIGGSLKEFAFQLGVSSRTVEGWSQGKKMSSSSAYQIFLLACED